jgi:hypothetical protein
VSWDSEALRIPATAYARMLYQDMASLNHDIWKYKEGLTALLASGELVLGGPMALEEEVEKSPTTLNSWKGILKKSTRVPINYSQRYDECLLKLTANFTLSRLNNRKC